MVGEGREKWVGKFPPLLYMDLAACAESSKLLHSISEKEILLV